MDWRKYLNMRSLKELLKNISVFLIVLFIQINITAQTIPLETFTFQPDEYIFQILEKGDNLSSEDFMYGALCSSTKDTEKIAELMLQYEDLAKQIESDFETLNISSLYDQGEYILTFLHENLFSRYSYGGSCLINLFEKGIYNCSSSSIVYTAYAMKFNIPLKGVLAPQHMFCSVLIADEYIDVETTNKFGFDPGVKKTYIDSNGRERTSFSRKKNYPWREDLNILEILSQVLHNNISNESKKKNYMVVIQAAINNHFLLQTEESYETLLDMCSNYVYDLSKKKMTIEALMFLESFAENFETNAKLIEITSGIFNNGIIHHVGTSYPSEEEIKQAESLFNTYKNNSLIDEATINESKKLIDLRKIWLFVENSSFSQATQEIDSYFQNDQLYQQDYDQLIQYVYHNEINRLIENKLWEEAIFYATEAGNKSTKSNNLIILTNRMISTFFHNSYVTSFNKQDFQTAKEILEEGLAFIPNDKILLYDLKTVNSCINSY